MPPSKGGSIATRQVLRKILGGLADKTGDGDDLASVIADSRYILCLPVPSWCLQHSLNATVIK